MRLLREIARLRRQIDARRARTRAIVEDSRRLCIESRHLVRASDDWLEHLHVMRRRA